MNIKELVQFTKDYDIKITPKLIKYLVIIGISSMKSKTQDISIETIKLIASSCKQQKLRSGLAELKQKVMNIEQSMSPRTGNFRFFEEQKPKLSIMESQCSPIQKRQVKTTTKSSLHQSNLEKEFGKRSLHVQKENELFNDPIFRTQHNRIPKKPNIDQIATNFLSSPLIKSTRNFNQQADELQYFFQNTYHNWKQF